MAITNKNCETISFLATYPYLQPKYWMSFFHLAKENWNLREAVAVSSFCHGASPHECTIIINWLFLVFIIPGVGLIVEYRCICMASMLRSIEI